MSLFVLFSRASYSRFYMVHSKGNESGDGAEYERIVSIDFFEMLMALFVFFSRASFRSYIWCLAKGTSLGTAQNMSA